MGKVVIQTFPDCIYGLFLKTDSLSRCKENKDQGNFKIFKRKEIEGGSGNTGIMFLIYL